MAAPDGDRFLKELRSSRRARLLRMAFPAAALALVAAFAWQARHVPRTSQRTETPVPSAGAMATPELEGWTRDGRMYSFKASTMTPADGDPDTAMLEEVEAWIEDGEGGRTTVSAPRGSFSRERGVLALDGPVTVGFPDGCRATLGSATWDRGEGAVSGRDGVSVARGALSIEADSFRSEPSRAITSFSGKVKAVMAPRASACGVEAASGEHPG